MSKVARKDAPERWGRWEDRSHLCGIHPLTRNTRVTRAWANQVLSVQLSEVKTEWGKVIHLWVRRHDQGTGVTWSDLQRIKDEIVGPERIAVQVFPAQADLVDEANMYHLWVLPEGFKLPFGLERVGEKAEG